MWTPLVLGVLLVRPHSTANILLTSTFLPCVSFPSKTDYFSMVPSTPMKLHGSLYSRKEELSIHWKLDWRIVPILMSNLILTSCDKLPPRPMPCTPFPPTISQTYTNICSYALRIDCDLTGNRYSWARNAFYFGYLIALSQHHGCISSFSLQNFLLLIYLLGIFYWLADSWEVFRGHWSYESFSAFLRRLSFLEI